MELDESILGSVINSVENVPLLDVVFEDADFVAINKPHGIPVHRDRFSKFGSLACLQILRDQIGCKVYPVHRLDAATSGVLLFAKSPKMLSQLMTQFELRQVRKKYRAIVRGWIQTNVECAIPLKVDGLSRDSNSQYENSFAEAFTAFSPIAHLEMPWTNRKYSTCRYTYLEVVPQTGRYHQIRRHGNQISHPVIGDTKHGNGEHNQLWRTHQTCHRLLLHASSLEFFHPELSKMVHCEASLPEDFAMHIDQLPWQYVCRANII